MSVSFSALVSCVASASGSRAGLPGVVVGLVVVELRLISAGAVAG